MEVHMGGKFRKGRIEEFVIERLEKLRKPLKRNNYDRFMLTEAIRLLKANLERDDERELFRLWSLPDPRGQ